jgi:hypothetical protein
MSQLLEADLCKIHDFMRSQTHVLGDDHIHKLHDAQCLSLVARIGALPVLEVQEATQLTDVLGRGPWGHDHKTKIASAIADRLTQGSPGGSGSVHSHRRCMQDLGCFHEYLTQADIDTLKDSAISLVAKLSRVASRCISIGLLLPNEKTVGTIVAVLLTVGVMPEAATSDDKFRVVQELKDSQG